MQMVELRLRAAFLHHQVQASPNVGYFLCLCGCGYVGVCRHCVPTASLSLPSLLCDEARRLMQSGRTCCNEQEGGMYVVADGE